MLLSRDLTEFLLEVSNDPAGLGDAGPEVNESSQGSSCVRVKRSLRNMPRGARSVVGVSIERVGRIMRVVCGNQLHIFHTRL